MSERKVLNKYYPPDFDPSKIPRAELPKNRQYTVRLMAPFNMRCATCGEFIYKGKKFNARKEDVENDTYLGIRIYRFYIKCTRCLQEISFKTDPKNTDYEIEAGAIRNFMALKLAEEQAEREEAEIREEEANNPMKLLENRTEQSRNEIEMIESLEELRDLNRRQQTVDYSTMLKQFNAGETERERLEREQREDEEIIKSMKFGYKTAAANNAQRTVVVEEVIEEIAYPTTRKTASVSSGGFAKPQTQINASLKRKAPLVLVKPKTKARKDESEETAAASQESSKPTADEAKAQSRVAAPETPAQCESTKTSGELKLVEKTAPTNAAQAGSGLSLLAAYSDSESD